MISRLLLVNGAYEDASEDASGSKNDDDDDKVFRPNPSHPDPNEPSIVELTVEQWGQRNDSLSNPDHLRFGTTGSKSVKPAEECGSTTEQANAAVVATCIAACVVNCLRIGVIADP